MPQTVPEDCEAVRAVVVYIHLPCDTSCRSDFRKASTVVPGPAQGATEHIGSPSRDGVRIAILMPRSYPVVCSGVGSTDCGDIAKEPSFKFLNRDPYEHGQRGVLSDIDHRLLERLAIVRVSVNKHTDRGIVQTLRVVSRQATREVLEQRLFSLMRVDGVGEACREDAWKKNVERRLGRWFLNQ